jgi:beta-glucanase (GH16 family)
MTTPVQHGHTDPAGTAENNPRPHIAGLFRRLTAATLGAALLLTACTSGSGGKPPKGAGWTLLWSDDFTGAKNTGLSRTEWLYNVGTSYPGGAPNWGTGQVEASTDSTANVYHDGDGHLAIRPTRDRAGKWTSGRVETKRADFAAPAGGKVRIEASLQQPKVGGAEAAGYWPAFWALGMPARAVGATNWPHIGEWDMMENINGRPSVWQTLHCGEPVGGPCGEPDGIGSGEQPCAKCQDGFHTYAIEYDRTVTPEQLRWYVDDRQTFTVAANRMDPTTWQKANQHGFFIILNVSMGGVFPAKFGGGPTPATKSGVPMLVDRVAVYTGGTASIGPR